MISDDSSNFIWGPLKNLFLTLPPNILTKETNEYHKNVQKPLIN